MDSPAAEAVQVHVWGKPEQEKKPDEALCTEKPAVVAGAAVVFHCDASNNGHGWLCPSCSESDRYMVSFGSMPPSSAHGRDYD